MAGKENRPRNLLIAQDILSGMRVKDVAIKYNLSSCCVENISKRTFEKVFEPAKYLSALAAVEKHGPELAQLLFLKAEKIT